MSHSIAPSIGPLDVVQFVPVDAYDNIYPKEIFIFIHSLSQYHVTLVSRCVQNSTLYKLRVYNTLYIVLKVLF